MDARHLDGRIWRVRRRGDWIDASLAKRGAMWRLAYTRKGRRLAEWNFDSREQAVDAARAKLREFERAGWTEHW
jgi:hypothetical protein